jgi:hypothetical protein
MQKNNVKIIALAFLAQVVIPGATCQARAVARSGFAHCRIQRYFN